MLETRRPFTRADAVAAGIAPKHLQGSRFRKLFRGVYVDARVPDHPLIRAQGALLTHVPSAMVSHTTAALVYELPVSRDSTEHVMVATAAERSRREGVRCHVGPVGAARVVSGVRVAPPDEVFTQLASVLGLVDLVVVGDAMLRRGYTTRQQLADHCAAFGGRHRGLARRAVAFVRERVDSPMESRLRMLLVLAGLPEPEVNLSQLDRNGSERMRLDLSYPTVKVAVEYDGRQHAESKRQWRRDLDRREELDDDQWRIIVVTSEGIYVEPERTLERVHAVLRARRFRGLPTHLSDAWRPHFPVRRSA